jgi:gamma-glutamyltranspeptidase/glutathione hydrolase
MAIQRATPAVLRTASSPGSGSGVRRSGPHTTRIWRSFGGCATSVLIPLALAGCGGVAFTSSDGSRGYRTVGEIAGVAADEPAAAEAGARMLEAGGTAADAVAAAGFVLAVALPDRAGLGGGGRCIVHDTGARTVRVLDFLPAPGPAGFAAPTMAGGLAALQGASGRLRWPQVVAQAELLARGEAPLSRAAASAMAQAVAAPDAATRAAYLPGGRAPAEGARLPLPDLAETLARVRSQLGGGRTVSDRVAAAVGADPASLAVPPRWTDAASLRSGDDELRTAGEPDGALAAAARAGGPERIAALEAALRAAAPAGVPYATAAALDRFETAVACGFTLGAPFGTGRTAPGTGVVLAAPAAAPPPLAVVMNANVNDNLFVGAGGRPSGPSRIACTIVGAEGGKRCAPAVDAGSGGLAAQPGDRRR